MATQTDGTPAPCRRQVRQSNCLWSAYPDLLLDLHIDPATYDDAARSAVPAGRWQTYAACPALGLARSSRPHEPPTRQACENCDDRGNGECSTEAGCYAGVHRALEGASNRI